MKSNPPMRIACVKPESDGGATIGALLFAITPIKVDAEYVRKYQPKAGDVFVGREIEPMTPEDLKERVDGFMMIVRGFLKLAGVERLIEEQAGQNEFPSELEASDEHR